jgi:2-polyprenyl-3-methyl-5-hydroxy-6-metoxy-1,4-benzoquinol methylase
MTTTSRGSETPETLHQRAIACWQRGETAAALDAAREAVSSSLDLEILNDLGVMSAKVIGSAAGEAVFETVLAVDATREDARRNLDALRGAVNTKARAAEWRSSATLGGPDPMMPERAFPGMPGASVMREHALRYAFVLDLVAGHHVLDLGCGTGYGSEMLGWTAASVRGFDLWEPEAHERPRWPGGAVLTYGHDLCTNPLPRADIAVAFEVVEHLPDAPGALRTAWGAVDAMIISFPNPVYHGSHHNPYHVNDWPLDEVERQLSESAVARFSSMEIVHFKQDHLDGSGGMVMPGRDPEASYWILVARGLELR